MIVEKSALVDIYIYIYIKFSKSKSTVKQISKSSVAEAYFLLVYVCLFLVGYWILSLCVVLRKDVRIYLNKNH